MTGGMTIEQEEIERIFVGFTVEAQKQLASQIDQPRQRVLVLAGPTAVGKSDFAIRLAKLLGGEIISADAIQVYRGMDIGTAKMNEEEQREVPHHLIDIRDVKELFNVVDFYYEARQCCKNILARDRVPIITGGSGFYLHSLIYGPPSGPPSVPELRQSLEEEFDKEGPDVMYAKLKQLDPQYAGSITKNDKQKIVRGLEIIRLTGNKVSKLSWKGKRRPQNYDFHCWFLTRPKDVVYQRIEKRCRKMIDQGFLDEVQELEKKGIRDNASAAQAIGYRQALEYLASPQTKADHKQFIEKFLQASRRYAKRQFTWFRREPGFRWLDLELHDEETAMEMVIQDYQAR